MQQTYQWSGAEELARDLLDIRAVELRPSQPFTWSSGWKSPMYCDNRTILGYPMVWDRVVSGLEEVIRTCFPGTDVLAGTATAGIPHAAALSRSLRLPMAYVRGRAKGHGKQKRVEGRCQPGLRAVVIEDTLSTGQSAFDAVCALQEEGMEVLGIAAIFSYDFSASQVRSVETGIPAVRLMGYDMLIETAHRLGKVAEVDLERLSAWRKQPDNYQ